MKHKLQIIFASFPLHTYIPLEIALKANSLGWSEKDGDSLHSIKLYWTEPEWSSDEYTKDVPGQQFHYVEGELVQIISRDSKQSCMFQSLDIFLS